MCGKICGVHVLYFIFSRPSFCRPNANGLFYNADVCDSGLEQEETETTEGGNRYSVPSVSSCSVIWIPAVAGPSIRHSHRHIRLEWRRSAAFVGAGRNPVVCECRENPVRIEIVDRKAHVIDECAGLTVGSANKRKGLIDIAVNSHMTAVFDDAGTSDRYDLNRFLQAQQNDYQRALGRDSKRAQAISLIDGAARFRLCVIGPHDSTGTFDDRKMAQGGGLAPGWGIHFFALDFFASLNFAARSFAL
jgi:hypothetical protein